MKTLQQRVEWALSVADTQEKQAAEWIKENPHMALVYARAAHEKYYHENCACELVALNKIRSS